MGPILQESAISVTNVHKSILQQIPPWIIKKTQVILQLNKFHTTKTHPRSYLENFHTILLHHPDHQYLFTNGSKDNNKTAGAAVLNETIHKKTLPMKSSIFTAEVCAIDLAFNIISRDKYNKFIIFFDSLSVLTSLKNKKLENPLIVKLLSRLDSMSSYKKIVVLDSKPHRSERKWKSWLGSQISLWSKPWSSLHSIYRFETVNQ